MALKRDVPTPWSKIRKFALGQVRRLVRGRGWAVLPQDEVGRGTLIAMLFLGMTGPDAIKIAPWARTCIDQLCIEADRLPLDGWTERLGQMVRLLDQEREDFRVRQLRPCDVPWEIVQARVRERRRVRDRNRGRIKRAAKAKRREELDNDRDLDVRGEAVYRALDGKWTAVRGLDQLIGSWPCFRSANGRQLSD